MGHKLSKKIGSWFAAGLLAVALLFGNFTAQTAQAALLYTGSANQVVYVGETFVVEWYLDTRGEEINSMALNLLFDPTKLEVVETSAGNSSIDLWVKGPDFDNVAGKINLIGGIASGLNDKKLSIFRATFRPLETGDAKISMAQDSELLISDGLGTQTNIIFNEVNFRINPASAKPAEISSPTHPNQEAWYKDGKVEIQIKGKDGEEYSYSFSSNLEIFPDPNPDEINSPVVFEGLPDGIYYFKLNSRLGEGNWQEAGVFRISIDSTPPREFTPQIGKDPGVFDGRAFVTFNTTDNISGVSYYEVKSNFLGGWKRVDDGYFKLPGLVLGDTITVKVVDEAGNERVTEVEVDKTLVNSVFSRPIFWVIMIISLIAIIWVIRHYLRLLKKYKVSEKL